MKRRWQFVIASWMINACIVNADLGDGQYPNNIEAETPHSGMANTLSTLWAARGLGDYVTAHAEFG